MEETKSEYLKKLREENLNEESYSDRSKKFAKFIMENGCKQQGEDEEDE